MSRKVQFFGNVRTSPVWMADFSGREKLCLFPAKLDATAFRDKAGIVIKANGSASADATSITIDAAAPAPNPVTTLISSGSVLVPAGVALYFGASKKLALVTQDVLVGDTEVHVQALPTALDDNDEAIYSALNSITVPSGTLVGRTLAERDANAPFGPAAYETDEEIFLTAFDVADLNKSDDVELYRHGFTVKENYLPQWADFVAGEKAWLRANYQCIVGVD